MTEPVYEYVRGTGWVPATEPARKFQTKDGVWFQVFLRDPKPGESWDAFYEQDYRTSTGEMDWEAYLENASTYQSSWLTPLPNPLTKHYDVYLTLVKLDHE